MRMYVIGDEDTVDGFRIAGVEGTVVESKDAAREALLEAEEREEAIVIIPNSIASWIQDEIDRIRYGAEKPLIVEVPGPEGAESETPSLFRLIREAVGIKFDEE